MARSSRLGVVWSARLSWAFFRVFRGVRTLAIQTPLFCHQESHYRLEHLSVAWLGQKSGSVTPDCRLQMEFAARLAIHSRSRRRGRALAGKARVAARAGCPALRSDGPAHPHSLRFIRSGISFHDVDLGTYHVAKRHGKSPGFLVCGLLWWLVAGAPLAADAWPSSWGPPTADDQRRR